MIDNRTCTYCCHEDNSKIYYDNYGANGFVYRDRSNWFLQIEDADTSIATIQINNCPWCGKELK